MRSDHTFWLVLYDFVRIYSFNVCLCVCVCIPLYICGTQFGRKLSKSLYQLSHLASPGLGYKNNLLG